jgi:cytochrome c-type biogenesis protein CcmF
VNPHTANAGAQLVQENLNLVPFQMGTVILAVVAFLSVIGFLAGVIGTIRKNNKLEEIAMRAAIGIFPLVVIASIVLVYGFVTDQFQIKYIAYNSERNMPLMYKFSAMWGSLEGSVLLWLLLLSGFTAASISMHRRSDRVLAPMAAAILLAVNGFFCILMLVTTNPFAALDFLPTNGLGLNPLLQNPGMAIHPPTMYIGFTSLTVPFAFAIAALVTGKVDAQWVRTTRVWTIISWIGLTLGNLLGANWAYVELGWGGYWGWDPVENSALMPWFTVTAFLHSIMIQEKRGMLKIWNASLILLSFWLTIFGTFLTRSGVVSSVHAFSDSNLGGVFLAFLAVIMLSSVVLLVWRWEELQPDNRFESALSRESAFLFNNVLLLGIAIVVLWGTTWPILVEAVTGKRASVGAPLFNELNAVPGLLLLLLMGIGPSMSWRKMKWKSLIRGLKLPAAVALVVGIAELYAGSRHYFAFGAAAFGSFTFLVIALEMARGAKSRARKDGNVVAGLLGLISKNPRRYAGYIVHVGVIFVMIALAGNLLATETTKVVKVGDTIEFAGWNFDLQEIRNIRRSNYYSTMSIFEVEQADSSGRSITMWPEKRKYRGAREEESTEVAIYSTLMRDLYVVVLDRIDRDRISVRLHNNPLVQWVWIGGVVMALGALLSIVLSMRNRRRLQQELVG